MARLRKEETAVKGDIEKLREKVIQKFFGLSEKMYNHIASSFVAERPCTACSIGADGSHQPGKAKDAQGKCAMCHGTYVIPDHQQRNWAAEMAQPIVAPVPKQVDVQVDQKSILPELEAAVKRLDNKSLTEKLALLGVSEVYDVAEDGSTGSDKTPDSGNGGPS